MQTITLDASTMDLYGLLKSDREINTLFYDDETNTYYLGNDHDVALDYVWLYTSYDRDYSPATIWLRSKYLTKVGKVTNVSEGVLDKLVIIHPN